MNENEIVRFRINDLGENTLQIYGTINGIVRRIFVEEKRVYVYDINIKFIKNNKLYEISNHNIRISRSIESLEEEILRIYNEEN